MSGVIAAVWSPDGLAAARGLHDSVVAAAGVAPSRSCERGSGVLSTWGGAGLDTASATAWLGPAVLAVAPADGVVGARVSLDADGVTLERGPLGGRPMYYARVGAALVACSRLALLARALPTRPAWSADRLATMACVMTPTTPSETPLRGVSRLASREALRFTGRVVVRTRRAPPRLTELTGYAPEQAAEDLWRLIERCVARAVGPSRRVGVMAGGGLDSSGLAAAAVAQARGASPREVELIALDFASRGDDRPYLVDLARALGLVPLRLDPRAARPWFRGSLVVDGGPYLRSSGALERLVLEEARARGVDVLLAGVGGDDLFRADPRALVVAASPLAAFGRALTLEVPWPSTPASRVLDFVVRPALAELLPRAVVSRWRARALASPRPWCGPRVRALLASRRGAPVDRLPRTPSERYVRLADDPWLLDMVDGWGALEAVTGLARAHPFLDGELLEHLCRVPTLALSHGGRDRALLRGALRAGGVPESICARESKAWFEPALAAAAGGAEGLASLRGLARAPRLAALGVVARGGVASELERLARDPVEGEAPQLWERVWPVLAVEACLEER